MKFTRMSYRTVVAGLLLFAVSVSATAFAENEKTPKIKGISKTKSPVDGYEVVDVFKAIDAKQIEVKLIAPNVEKANMIVKNNSDKPLSIKIPAAFAGVPVLAQGIGGGGGGFGGQGGGGQGGGGFGGGGQGGGNQGFGGGGGQGQGGGGFGGQGGGGFGGGGGGQRGGGLFNIPAGKVGRVQIAIVCLEHGKKDPTARVKYEIKPIESIAKTSVSAEVLKMMAEGEIHRDIAQACAWHLENGLSWQELASKDKVVSSFGGFSQKYFSLKQIAFSQQVCVEAARRADELAKQKKTEKKYNDKSEFLNK